MSPIINYLIQYIYFHSSYMMTYLCVKFKENPCVGTFVTHCFGQVVLSSLITMTHKNEKHKEMVAVKSKLKIITYRPEEQQTDLTSVYDTCQKSQIGYVLT